MQFILFSVILSLFIITSESRDFCEAFKDNGNRIDYTFNFFRRNTENKNDIRVSLALIIGYEYWIINSTNYESIKLVTNESRFSEIFGNHYSFAFSLFRDSPQDLEYGFLRVTNELNNCFKYINNVLYLEKRLKD